MSDPVKLGLAAWYNESATYELPYSDDEKANMRRTLAVFCEAEAANLDRPTILVGNYQDQLIAWLRRRAAELREER